MKIKMYKYGRHVCSCDTLETAIKLVKIGYISANGAVIGALDRLAGNESISNNKHYQQGYGWQVERESQADFKTGARL